MNSVVPVRSAISCRVIGCTIRMPWGDRSPPCSATRSRALAIRTGARSADRSCTAEQNAAHPPGHFLEEVEPDLWNARGKADDGHPRPDQHSRWLDGNRGTGKRLPGESAIAP